MRRLYPVLLLLFALCGVARAGDSVTLSSVKRVAVSTSTETTLLSPDPQAKKTCLLNDTTNYLLIGDASTTFSTSDSTGTFKLPGTVASTNPCWYCFDPTDGAYKGGLKAIAPGASAAVNVSVLREK